MECPECAQAQYPSGTPIHSVEMKESATSYRCLRCGHKIRRGRTVAAVSERDVARVLQAVAYIERWDEREVCTSVRRTLPDGRGSWKTTPEGWPVPSRLLMQQIAKLL